jgi:hypothetical protein
MSTLNEACLMTYEFFTKKGEKISISIEDTEENPRFKIEAPTEIMSKIIGGIGFETQDGKTTIITENNLDTEAKRMFVVLELTKKIQTGEL